MTDRIEKAQKVMVRIYGNHNDPDARLACLIQTIRNEKANSQNEEGSYIECFKGTDLKRTLAVMLIYGTANLAGAAFLAQAIYFLIIAGLPAIHAFDVSIGGFALACFIIVGTWFLMERVRNRTAFYVGIVINFAAMIVIGCLYYSSSKGALWAIAAIM